MPTRPVSASTAADNVTSQRVLERCGFERTGEQERAFVEARGEEIDEVMFRLD